MVRTHGDRSEGGIDEIKLASHSFKFGIPTPVLSARTSRASAQAQVPRDFKRVPLSSRPHPVLRLERSNNSGASGEIVQSFTRFMVVTCCFLVAVLLSGCGTPQPVSSTTTTSQSTLTGYCFGPVRIGEPDQCRSVHNPTQCPAGQNAIKPTQISGCVPPTSEFVDAARMCGGPTPSGLDVSGGNCVAIPGSLPR
jgi:hypothetical protein